VVNVAWGHLERGQLLAALCGDLGIRASYVSGLDRNGDGRISRREYERWAHGHAHHLHRERQAWERLRRTEHELRKGLAEARKRAQAEAQKSLAQARAHAGAWARAQQRAAAAASLRVQQKKAHAQHAQTHQHLVGQQRALAAMRRHAGPTRRVTPAKWHPPRQARAATHKPASRKPAVRKAPVQPLKAAARGGGHPGAALSGRSWVGRLTRVRLRSLP
jgi:hypothetical protein